MQIPDCYDPICQMVRRERDWDIYLSKLPDCIICGRKIMEGQDAHKTRGKAVCSDCLEDLNENAERVEVA